MVTGEGDGNFIAMCECNRIWRYRSRSKTLSLDSDRTHKFLSRPTSRSS